MIGLDPPIIASALHRPDRLSAPICAALVRFGMSRRRGVRVDSPWPLDACC